MKHLFLLSVILTVGCTTPAKPISYGSSQSPKVMLYEEPEVIFKDEHTPGSCRSPFR
jgi:hypothetical protein